jgi:hypothetical protein
LKVKVPLVSEERDGGMYFSPKYQELMPSATNQHYLLLDMRGNGYVELEISDEDYEKLKDKGDVEVVE